MALLAQNLFFNLSLTCWYARQFEYHPFQFNFGIVTESRLCLRQYWTWNVKTLNAKLLQMLCCTSDCACVNYYYFWRAGSSWSAMCGCRCECWFVASSTTIGLYDWGLVKKLYKCRPFNFKDFFEPVRMSIQRLVCVEYDKMHTQTLCHRILSQIYILLLSADWALVIVVWENG